MPSDRNLSATLSRRTPTLEAFALVAILALCTAPYFLRLGLYNDDWAFIAAFRDLPNVHDWTDPHVQIIRLFYIRPLHGLWTWLLFKCFGTHPLPYHLVNMAVLTGSILLGYRLLRSFPIAKAYAFPIAAVYSLLPQLSTVKVWYAAYCATLSQLFFLAGANATLRWIDTGRRRWKVAVLICWIASILTYELFIPLIAAFAAFAIWKRALEPSLPQRDRWRRAAPEMLDLSLVFLSLALKAFLTDRIEGAGPRRIVQMFIARWYDPLIHYGLNARWALIVNFWETLWKPLGSIGRLLAQPDAAPRLACATAIAAIVFLVAVRHDARARQGMLLAGLGFLLFWLGYAIFFLTLQTGLTSAGTANRTAVAAAFGVAFVAVGGSAMLARLAPPAVRGHLAAGTLAFMCFALALRSSEVDGYWAAAYARQQEFLAKARTDLAPLAPGSTIMVAGLCQYAGPASVFETWWDTSGALKLRLGKDIRADIVSPGISILSNGIRTTIYGRVATYPYARSLFAYDTRRRQLIPLTNRAAAVQALGGILSAKPANGCPVGHPGHGVPI